MLVLHACLPSYTRVSQFASEPNVTEEELKLMLRVAELSGAIEEEEQVFLSKQFASVKC